MRPWWLQGIIYRLMTFMIVKIKRRRNVTSRNMKEWPSDPNNSPRTHLSTSQWSATVRSDQRVGVECLCTRRVALRHPLGGCELFNPTAYFKEEYIDQRFVDHRASHRHSYYASCGPYRINQTSSLKLIVRHQATGVSQAHAILVRLIEK